MTVTNAIGKSMSCRVVNSGRPGLRSVVGSYTETAFLHPLGGKTKQAANTLLRG